MTDRPNVLIVVTGGILAKTGLNNEDEKHELKYSFKELFAKELDNCPEFKHAFMPLYDILVWNNPIESTLFNPTLWIKLAKEIESNYEKYSGFVVVHGSDTMAYTASALSFMLDGLSKPVVFTGAQIPLEELINDAKRNLIISILVAAGVDIPEVTICFSNTLTRANRTTKFDDWANDAFLSPNFPPLAKFGIDIFINHDIVLEPPKRKFKLYTNLFTNIVVFWLIPGFNTDIIEKFLVFNKKDKAIVLVCFGSGNAPIKESFKNVLKEVRKTNHVEVVITSQCMKGSINLQLYKTGVELYRMGFINAMDMTIEACVTKLSWLMGHGLRGQKLKDAMKSNIRGELTSNRFKNGNNEYNSNHAPLFMNSNSKKLDNSTQESKL